ncbi:hypothetical protein Hanom_Chr03g00180921 [Helianthus anomalus]
MMDLTSSQVEVHSSPHIPHRHFNPGQRAMHADMKLFDSASTTLQGMNNETTDNPTHWSNTYATYEKVNNGSNNFRYAQIVFNPAILPSKISQPSGFKQASNSDQAPELTRRQLTFGKTLNTFPRVNFDSLAYLGTLFLESNIKVSTVFIVGNSESKKPTWKDSNQSVFRFSNFWAVKAPAPGCL